MLQERIEGKWLAAFRRVLALNGIGQRTRIAIISETQSRPVLVHLCELAAYDLGAAQVVAENEARDPEAHARRLLS